MYKSKFNPNDALKWGLAIAAVNVSIGVTWSLIAGSQFEAEAFNTRMKLSGIAAKNKEVANKNERVAKELKEVSNSLKKVPLAPQQIKDIEEQIEDIEQAEIELEESKLKLEELEEDIIIEEKNNDSIIPQIKPNNDNGAGQQTRTE